MAGEAMAGLLTCPTWCYLCLCVLVPRLNSGRLAIYSCGHVEQHMGTLRFKVPR